MLERIPTERLRPHVLALAPGSVAVALMLLWAVHDGGYDADTWYWGALVLLATLTAVICFGRQRADLSRATVVSLLALALYVAWSYLSITWAKSPGDALQGSNRALLYLIVFALLVVLPWTPRATLVALTTFALGIGGIGILELIRLASGDNVQALLIAGRLVAPTGYFNSSAALFTIDALVAIALATRRELPAQVRGALVALAGSSLVLAMIVQSRGWLFTLPLVAIVAIAIVSDRLKVAVAAVLPMAAVLIPLHRLLAVYQAVPGRGLDRVVERAGKAGLLICAVAFAVATLAAWAEGRTKLPSLSDRARRALGAVVAALAIAAAAVGGTVATHGHPLRFVERQWNGFSHPTGVDSTQSHFVDVGSSRYDFWRVALDGFVANPIGGLGQDNFANYYVLHRHGGEDPAWTHSLELRLLAMTGLVGAVLFAVFLIAALRAAVVGRRRGDGLTAVVTGAALLPLVVWLIHGSIDWFWEMPALSGPALGFLGVAVALGDRQRVVGEERRAVVWRRERRPRIPRWAFVGTGMLALVTAVLVLGFPYLSVREISEASNVSASNPVAALSDLKTAAELNPLNADPGRLGGLVALQNHQYAVAQSRFGQAIAREPGGWYDWFGEGLASSALGERFRAHDELAIAAGINHREPAISDALARVYGAHPLSPAAALKMVLLAP